MKSIHQSSIFFSFLLFNIFISKISYCQNPDVLNMVELGDVNYCNSGLYDLVFSDNFEGNNIDTDKWYTYKPPYGGGSDANCVDCRLNPVGNAIFKDENITLNNGICNLTAKHESSIWQGVTRPYSSGFLTSKETFAFGKIEMNCKLPSAIGLYPTFWTFMGGTGGPDEIDIFEFCSENPTEVLSNIHSCYAPDGSTTPECNEQEVHGGFDFTSDFFTIGIYWSPYEVTWYIDTGSGPQDVRTYPRYYYPTPDASGNLVAVTTCDIQAGTYLENPHFPTLPSRIRASLRVKVCDSQNFTIENDNFPDNFEVQYINVFQNVPCNQPNQYKNLTLLENTEWNNDNKYFSNLTIKDDITLTINNSTVSFASIGQLKMGSGSKLILNGSTLTSCDPNVQWQGVSTNSAAGIDNTLITLENNSVIENAITGLYLKKVTWTKPNSTQPTLQLPDLIIKNSTIRNCNVGINIEQSKTTSITPHITDSTIEDCLYTGLKLHRSNGLIIDNTTFSNNHEAIRSIDSYIQVRDGNKFENGDIGISVEGTFPGTAGIDIGNADLGFNTFENIDEGIVSSGVEHPAGANITNCKFLTGDETAIAFVGANDYLVSNNDFEGYNTGVLPEWTGDNLNNVQCNNFDDLCVGTIYWDENNESEFLENNFTTNHADVIVYYATLKDDVGRSDEAAANCFSAGVYDLATEFNQSFDYHYFDDSANEACQEPFYDGNYVPLLANVVFGNCGGDIGVFNLIGTGGDVTLNDVFVNPDQICTNCVKDSINKWITNVVNVGGDNPLTAADEETNPYDPVLPDYEEIMTEWINFGIFIAIKTNNEGLGDDILIPLKKWRWQKRLYGFKLLMENVSEAEAILNDLETTTQNQINFKTIQQINIKRFKDFDSNNLITTSEVNQLANLATQKYPSSGYARSLYRLLSGVRPPVEVPDYDTILGRKIRSPERNKEFLINIYPNPFTDIFTIDLNDNDVTEVEVLSLDKKKVYSVSVIKPTVSINLSDLNPGLYFLRLKKSTGSFIDRKIIKL